MVAQWLRDAAGVSEETASLVTAAGVDGQLLIYLSSSDLKEIGIESRFKYQLLNIQALALGLGSGLNFTFGLLRSVGEVTCSDSQLISASGEALA